MSLLAAARRGIAAIRTGTGLPAVLGTAVYLVLLLAGDKLLNDPDTYWQVTLGQWMLAHRVVPHVDMFSWTMQGEPWISTQWLAQVIFAAAFDRAGWAGPVALSAAAIAFAVVLLARALLRHWSVRMVVIAAVWALLLAAPHLLVRPHALALPVMVAWVALLVNAADRRKAPSLFALPLMTLWANLHGGFVLGVALVGAFALDAVASSEPAERRPLLLRWIAFGIAALVASCITPYGYESLLASCRILTLGDALSLIGEWRPADFSHAGTLEFSVLALVALALWRGAILPPVRLVLVIGLAFMALGHVRNAEVFALLAPLVVARPLSQRLGPGVIGAADGAQTRGSARLVAVVSAATVLLSTLAIFVTMSFAPAGRSSPVAAVDSLKSRGITRVLNDYDFGGYMIAAGLPPYIDGRTELYGEKFVVNHHNALSLADPDAFLRLLRDPRIEATLLRPAIPGARLLDRIGGWRKIYADDAAVAHVRDAAVLPEMPAAVSPAR